ncbi:MAG: hypothetical protein JNK07_10820 [Alphaproteobacteria bacterium]|nr:hypothetical protein [Alphaproteobacteria bacterium]
MTKLSSQDAAKLSAEELKRLSERVGFDLSRFSSSPLPSDITVKLPLSIWTGVVLASPFLLAGLHVVGIAGPIPFALACATVMALNGAALEYVRHEIYSLRKDWEKSIGAIRASTGEKACEATHSTIQNFRKLMDWEYSTRYLTIPFVFLYVGLILYSAYCVAPILVAVFDNNPQPYAVTWATLPMAFQGEIAIIAFIFYWTAFGLRQWIVRRIFSYTSNIDPSLQICVSIAEIYKRFEETSVGRRYTAESVRHAA